MSAAGTPKNVVRQYFPNGVLASEGEIDAAGELHGLHREWYETGVLRSEREFHRGQWIWIRNYSPRGKLVRETSEGADFLPIVKTYAD